MKRIIALLSIAALAGCATTSTKVGKDKHGNPYFEQSIKARSKATVELAGQNFDGTLHTNPITGDLDVELKSGQEAEGTSAEGLDVVVQLLSLVASAYSPLSSVGGGASLSPDMIVQAFKALTPEQRQEIMAALTQP